MLQYPSRSHGRALFSAVRPRACLATNPPRPLASDIAAASRSRDALHQQCRDMTTRNRSTPVRKIAQQVNRDMLKTSNALSEQLLATGVWDRQGMKPGRLASAPVKRGTKGGVMGRPRKNAVKATDTDQNNSDHEKEPSEVVERPAVKRGAKGGVIGRPRKSAVKTAEALQNKGPSEAAEKSGVKPGAKRGRQSKKGTVPEIDTLLTKDEDKNDAVDEPGVKRGSKGGRLGRPPKAPEDRAKSKVAKRVANARLTAQDELNGEEANGENTAENAGEKETRQATKGDRSRVHLINEDLVKDTIEYLKPTLERHKGCDLVSVYPGAGLWTKALHDAVQPRSHLLLEPDEDTYRPFLQPLLDQDGVRMVPNSGIIWEELDPILTPEYLPKQVAFDRNDPNGPPRNDKLLVSMNLAMFPKKKFLSFESMSRMVVYQLIHTIRTSGLYQKYGQVRMLIWIPDDEKAQILPRILHARKKLAVESELSTEYIAEVCGVDAPAMSEVHGVGGKIAQVDANDSSRAQRVKVNLRWPQMDLESVRLVHRRMQENGMKTPPGRETRWLSQLKKYDSQFLEQPVPMEEIAAEVGERYIGEKVYLDLLARHRKKPFASGSADMMRLKLATKKADNNTRFFQDILKWLVPHDAAVAAYQAAEEAHGKPDSAYKELLAMAHELEAQLDALTATLPKISRGQRIFARDMIHILRGQPADLGPVLSWDRRPYEPLPVTPQDFFPNVPCALLDIQPSPCHPLLRAIGPGTSNAGAMFDMILGVMLDGSANSVARQVAGLWPAAADDVLPQCKTLWDPARGGIPLRENAALTNRALNRTQLLDILEQFLEWPFRPTYLEMVGRLSPDEWADDDDGVGDHRGNAAFLSQ
ncbi:unnamed protein product [Discula destructiva]